MKLIVVTGGTRGIGAAIVQSLLSDGYQVVATGRNTAEISSENKLENLTYKDLNLSNTESTQRFCNWISKQDNLFGLVNNAGINKINDISEITSSDFEDVLTVNLRAVFYISQSASQILKHRGGRIVNIGSIWSVVTKPGRVSYSTAKAALAGMTRGLAADLSQFGVLVNMLSPGFVNTELTSASLSESEIEAMCEQIPRKRLAQPEEIANVVSFLVGEKNTYMTGQNLLVDGGFSIV